ncbi:MAG TPA: cell division protein ZipA C-terminal FtsZ-binding domain-containing protein [Steroidobacteraceae bacterium]|nr:cell division protein ZipA C-terminal FtsZ-binding domain-containing protein [Steroidobacteraceae bacterium]
MPELRLTLLIAGLIFLIGLTIWELRRPRHARGSDLSRATPEPPERLPDSVGDWDAPALELPHISARDPEAQLPVIEVGPAEFAALEARADGVPAAEVSAAEVPAEWPDGGMEVLPATPVVDWPAADESQVISVRLVSVGEKFSGRAVRLALAAEGFVLGKFSIFHKAAADGRALLSVAGLNKPGTFDIDSIDLQRYGGLNLFTVLPGPLPGPDAVDELLACAQVLSQRLRGALQDEHGEALSPARTAVMRELAAAAQA